MKKCCECGRELVIPPTGRGPTYCSDACKTRACCKQKATPLHFRSDSNEWETPPALFAELDAEYHFTLDVAASPDNAKCADFFTKEQDGLRQRWYGRVWCNPPYGGAVGEWLHKAQRSIKTGEAEIVVCLIPARTDTNWWHDVVIPYAEVRFLRHRVRFLRPGGVEVEGGGAPFPSAVVVFRLGPQYQ